MHGTGSFLRDLMGVGGLNWVFLKPKIVARL